MALVVPFTFATAGANTPTSQLDSNFSTIASYINNRNPTAAPLASRPAAGNAGALFFDSGGSYQGYVDDGTAWQTLSAISTGLHGQCRLTLSGANLLLSPRDGNKLIINSVVQAVPSAGVTLAIGAALASTTYFIYAFMSAGVMMLEFSTTGHATQSATGVEIKSGDATRTLVGMARTTLAPAWADSATQRFTISWFNRQVIGGTSAFTVNRSTASTAYVEINSEIRVEFVTWGSESVLVSSSGAWFNSGPNSNQASLGFDGATAEEIYNQSNTGGAYTIPFAVTIAKSGLAEGYHFATLLGLTGAGTETFVGGATPGARTALEVSIRG